METTKPADDLSIDTTIVRLLLVGFLRDGIRNPGFSKGIVGLSGGVDSAVSACLAVEALGPQNVVCIYMPYKTSNPQSKTDADLIATTIGVPLETVDITSMVDDFPVDLANDRLRAGNIMARARMTTLFDLSQRDRALVIGTSNKTETLLGYGTLHGDMACALNPLGDLYKTQVWQLARDLGVPKQIIEKVPSADLWIGQTDESELGFAYKEVDRLLYYMIDQRRSITELVHIGFSENFVHQVRAIVKKTQYKRRMPIVAKVSHRTVNLDFRYPRDWGI